MHSLVVNLIFTNHYSADNRLHRNTYLRDWPLQGMPTLCSVLMVKIWGGGGGNNMIYPKLFFIAALLSSNNAKNIEIDFMRLGLISSE